MSPYVHYYGHTVEKSESCVNTLLISTVSTKHPSKANTTNLQKVSLSHLFHGKPPVISPKQILCFGVCCTEIKLLSFHFLVDNTGSSYPRPPQACLPLNITMCHSTEVKVSPSELPLTGIKGRPDAAGKQREWEPQLGLQTSWRRGPLRLRLPMMGGIALPVAATWNGSVQVPCSPLGWNDYLFIVEGKKESGLWMEVLVVSGGVRNRWQKSICYLLLPVHRSALSLRCHTNYQHTLLLGSSRHGMQIAKSTLSFPFLRRFHHRHTSGQKRTARVPCFKAMANHEHSSSEMAIGFRSRTSGRMDC